MIFADVHVDTDPSNLSCTVEVINPRKRLIEILNNARINKADAVINLGDFSTGPTPKGLEGYQIWDENDTILKYSVEGNHDTDNQTENEFFTAIGISESYYSFNLKNWKFIVLNSKNPIQAIDETQLAFLRSEIESSTSKIIVLVHYLVGTGVRNLISELNATEKKVVAVFTGHTHNSYHSVYDGVYYISINSTTSAIYSDEGNTLTAQHWYKDNPPYAIISLSNAEMVISGQGVEDNWASSLCEYDGPDPVDLNLTHQESFTFSI